MHNLNKTIFILAMLLLAGFAVYKNEFGRDKIIKQAPPGTVQIDTNTFMDISEIRNISWLEYMYWTRYVFGPKSKQFHATLPDTTVWIRLGEGYKELAKEYLRGPMNHNQPVVGISIQQSIQYSHWRSDRVMEMLLIKEGYLNPNTVLDSNHYFTIDKLRAGQVKLQRLLAKDSYVPNYAIPAKSDWEKAWKYNLTEMQKRRPNPLITCISKFDTLGSKAYGKSEAVMEKVFIQNEDFKIRRMPIFVERYIEYLDSTQDRLSRFWYNDSAYLNKGRYFIDARTPNQLLGFRNVCKWVKL